MSRSRTLLLAGVLAVLVAALSGCVRISSVQVSQPASMGPVTLGVYFCATGSPGCTGTGFTGSPYNTAVAYYEGFGVDLTENGQLMFAVRLPNELVPSGPQSNDGLVWSPSPSYAAELTQLEPPPSGQRWWGWLSSSFPYGRLTPQSSFLSITVDLPPGPAGAPYPSPLIWRPVMGTRYASLAANPALTPDRPVECGDITDHLYTARSEQGTSNAIVCISSPDASGARGFIEAPFTDFGITGVSTEIGPAGGKVGVPFVVQRSGPGNTADNFTNFTLSVGGGPPGSSVSLSTTTAPLISPTTSVIATVDVPPNTPPGDYPITLQANAPGKPARSAAAILRVTAPPTSPTGPTAPGTPVAPDTTAPVISSLRISKNPFRRTTARPVTLTTRSTEGGTLAVSVQRLLPGRRVGSVCRTTARTGRACQVIKRVRTVRRATTGVAAVKLAGKGITRLAPGRYRAEVRVTDAAGNRSAPKRLLFTVRP